MGLKSFIVGILVALSISACGSLKFFYKFYIFDYENNMLRGSVESEDLKTDICAKNPDNKYKCVVMKIPDFYRLKTDYEKQKQRIVTLERQLSSCR